MDYSFIVGFSKAKSWTKIGSTIIRQAEKREFSHAFILYKDPITEVNIVSQASHGYVNEMNYDIFKKENDIIKLYKIKCSEQQFLEILKFIKTHLGVKYSKFQIYMIAIKKLLRLNNIDDFNKTMEFICSEWTAYICKIAEIKVPCRLDTFTPSDMDRLLDDLDDNMNEKVELVWQN